jgi:uncharacterized protein YndB with AHSA1/START domain
VTVHPDGTVRHEVTVDLPPEEAFWKFADFDKIKPREHNLLAVPIAETVLEQRAGGDLYDRGIDGTICRWGRVLTFDPPHSIAFSWDIGPDWQVISDLDRASEVEITFVAEGGHRTRVTLVHRHLDRHAEGWESLQAGVDAPDGWPLYLGRYVALTRDEPAHE